MKKILLILFALCATFSAKAQFEQDTYFVNASLSGLSLNYSKGDRFSMGIGAKMGYYFADQVAITGFAQFDHGHHKTTTIINNFYESPSGIPLDRYREDTYTQNRYYNDLSFGVGMRYNITQNGLYLDAGLAYKHYNRSHNDMLLPVEIGYTFYLNHYLTIEPSIHYDTSMFHFTDNSKVGFRLGMGYYF